MLNLIVAGVVYFYSVVVPHAELPHVKVVTLVSGFASEGQCEQDRASMEDFLVSMGIPHKIAGCERLQKVDNSKHVF